MIDSIIIQDYYGRKNIINATKSQSNRIFIIDDSKFYRRILEGSLSRKGYNVQTFSTGEEALLYISMKPDIIIIDYHLNSLNKYAQNGALIATLFKQKLPETEVILISSDNNFQLISKLNITRNVIYKDSNAFPKIQTNIIMLLSKLHKKKSLDSNITSYKFLRILFFIMILFFIISKMFL